MQGQNSTQANNGIVLLDGVLANFAGNTTSPTSFTSSTFNVPITLGDAQRFQSANAGARLYMGSINTADVEDNDDGTPSGIYVEGSGDIEVDGVISGRAGIDKSGTGTLYLTGSNSFIGGTELFEGSIQASNNTAFGQSVSAVIVQNWVSGSIQLSGGITVNNPLALGNFNGGVNYDIGALRNVSGTNYWNGPISLQPAGSQTYSTISADTGSELIINGPIVGPSLDGSIDALNFGGGGSVELNGTSVNQIQGDIRVWEGTLILNKTSVDPNTARPCPPSTAISTWATSSTSPARAAKASSVRPRATRRLLRSNRTTTCRSPTTRARACGRRTSTPAARSSC